MQDLNLWDHQLKAIEKARTARHLALFMDAGVGKTGAMIRILCEEYNRAKKIKKTIIFSPLTVCKQWKEEFARFSKVNPESILVCTGRGVDRTRELLKRVESKEPTIVITNYEAVQIGSFYEALLKWSPEIGVLDESHRIKDSQSKRAKKIYPLTLGCDRRFLLTGTPILNSLIDIFGQYKALDPTLFGGSFWIFRSKYFYDRNAGRKFSFPDWVPQIHASQEIGKILGTTSIQAKREECLDLPPLQIIPVPVALSVSQKKAYREMEKEFITEVNGMVSTSEFEMVKTLRMRQILAGFIQPDEAQEPEWFSEQPRLDTLMDIIDSIGKDKVIIWTEFRPTYQKIGERLTKAGIQHVFLTGDQSTAAQKEASIEHFRRGDAQVMIANPAAASEGINLQEAKYAIYYMRGYNLLHFLQSLARNYRGGSEKLHDRVIHYHLVANGTLDQVIHYALKSKKNVGDAVLQWSRGGMSEEAIPFDIVNE